MKTDCNEDVNPACRSTSAGIFSGRAGPEARSACAPFGNTTLFMATERGGFAWMDVGLILTTRISDAASAVLRYGFRSICVDDMGATQFPSTERVERVIHVCGATFWVDARVAGTDETDRTKPVPISEIRRSMMASAGANQVLYRLHGSEQVFQRYLESLSLSEREWVFGSNTAGQIARDFQSTEVVHG